MDTSHIDSIKRPSPRLLMLVVILSPEEEIKSKLSPEEYVKPQKNDTERAF